MINLKNCCQFYKNYFFATLFLLIISCSNQKNYVSKIEGKKIAITDKQIQDNEIDNFIKPYREKIDKDMSEVLAYNPEILDKNGQWQSNIGVLQADISMTYANKVFQKRYQKSIDILLLNHGGIRSILPKGNLTIRNAYQIAPFENYLFVVKLKGHQILELCNYFINEKKPHPLAGLTFTIDIDKKPINILIQKQALDLEKVYDVATSDYLSNGGDNMNFFKINQGKIDLDYKIRNIFIDYLKDIDTVSIDKSIRINSL